MYVQVDGLGADVRAALEQVPGVTRVSVLDSRGALTGFEVDSQQGRDVRRELAHVIVTRGWGLLEMRPVRMSLEEVFLQVTTDETQNQEAPKPAAEEPVQEAASE
jgi:ABC-2 type transport system ATP-binding protein